LSRTRLDHAWRPSPNIEERKDGKTADILLLHYTGMPDAEGACAWLCNPESKVSCHYLVDEEGRIVQMVEEGMRAWHAGASSWKDEADVNSRSIGIEIHNQGPAFGYPPFPDRQMDAVIELCRDILERHPIAPERVLGHSDVAPARKIDPGEKFDWKRLHEAGIGHWAPPWPTGSGGFLQIGDSGVPVDALKAMLTVYGYGLDDGPVFDRSTQQAVVAFQRHFRQERVDGIADQSTTKTLMRLLRALPAGP
jgi:N-acetylmuramoyl-L-alanine amidase